MLGITKFNWKGLKLMRFLRPRKLLDKKKPKTDTKNIEHSTQPMRIEPEKIRIKTPIVSTSPYDQEQIVRGPKERFSGNLDYNLTLLIERTGEKNLILEEYQMGTRAKKRVMIAYLENVANPGIVSEIKTRLSKNRTKPVLDSSYIERNIEDSNLSPFPQVETTPNPTVAESALLQGRVAIFVDQSPDVLLAPTTFFDLMDTTEDAFRRWHVASSFFKLARYILLIIAASLPGFYIGLTSYNPELIPTRLAFIIAGSREGTPFPVYFEAFFMMGVVEAVRMVIIRLPTALGSTIALFAGLLLAGAGISINIIGVPITMVVTLTIIASFGIPNNDLRGAIRIIQFGTMIMSTILGVLGFAISFFYLTAHLVNLKSFGIPYMTPLAPMEGSGWEHTVLRGNTKEMPRDESYKPS